MTKKTVILSLILAFTILPMGARAQVSEPVAVTSAELATQLESLKEQLITLLLAQIATLQEQIATLVAQQSATQTQLGAVQEQVTSVEEVAVEIPTPEVLVDFSCSAGKLIFHSTVSNGDTGYMAVWEGIDASGMKDGDHGGIVWDKTHKPTGHTMTLNPKFFYWEATAPNGNPNEKIGNKFGYEVNYHDKRSGTYDGTVCAN